MAGVEYVLNVVHDTLRSIFVDTTKFTVLKNMSMSAASAVYPSDDYAQWPVRERYDFGKRIYKLPNDPRLPRNSIIFFAPPEWKLPEASENGPSEIPVPVKDRSLSTTVLEYARMYRLRVDRVGRDGHHVLGVLLQRIPRGSGEN